jgi:hypothetical protein
MLRTAACVLTLSVLTAGCSYYGPDAVRMTRPEYNTVIQQTNEQELLLNLVRLKYRETPYFLNVEKVASSLEFSRGLSANAMWPEGAAKSLGLAGSVGFAERPTLFYAPLEGEKFVRQLMTPLSLNTLILLANSGWSVERVFAVTLQEMNGIRNAPTASGPTPAREPEFQEFRAALKHLRALQVRKWVELGRAPEGAGAGLELRFAAAAAHSEDALAFKRMLGLDPGRDRYRLVPGLGGTGGDTIAVATRSLIATMNYLSQGVEAPPADVATGRVTRTLADDGKAFDWQDMLAGIFRVIPSAAPPENAAVAVRYRSSWFQIRDDDLDSKATFSLLSQLLALQGGQIPGQGANISYSISR